MTTMSRSLPPEILDLIVDQLHDEPTTLKVCCLVSKSWIPRIRRHLFAHVDFSPPKNTFESWMRIFPDPSNSPAHHTRYLSILDLPTSIPMGMDVGSWIHTFRNVVQFDFERCPGIDFISLAPFFGFSLAVRSLYMTSTSFEVFDIVCSFPLLEDLGLIDLFPKDDTFGRNAPLTSPKLTGSLDLRARGEIRSVIRRLLNFPDGLRFADIWVTCLSEDFGSVTDLVSGCSSTLESLNIDRSDESVATPGGHFPNLSEASKLKHLTFLSKRSNIRWIVAALQTVESKNLEQITIHTSTPPHRIPAETDDQEWQDLDRLLVQFWTSHSIRPQIVYSPNSGGRDTRDRVRSLLPELTRRGLVDLVEYSPPS